MSVNRTPLERWSTLSRRPIYSGGPITELAIETVQLPDGRRIDDYHVLRMPDFALVFATTGDGNVIALRQYRHGVGRVGIGFPGGRVEAGESALTAAQRELREETGYESPAWTSLGSYVTNANQRCNVAHLFRAESCCLVTTPASGDLENQEILLLPPARLLTAASIEEIGMASHVALLTLATHPGLQTP